MKDAIITPANAIPADTGSINFSPIEISCYILNNLINFALVNQIEPLVLVNQLIPTVNFTEPSVRNLKTQRTKTRGVSLDELEELAYRHGGHLGVYWLRCCSLGH